MGLKHGKQPRLISLSVSLFPSVSFSLSVCGSPPLLAKPTIVDGGGVQEKDAVRKKKGTTEGSA